MAYEKEIYEGFKAGIKSVKNSIKLKEALKYIIWYNGHEEWLEEIAKDLELNSDYLNCPIQIVNNAEAHTIWMLLVGVFGNWGTSIRSGWIEKNKEAAEFIREILKQLKEFESNGIQKKR